MPPLLPFLDPAASAGPPDEREALRFPNGALSYAGLRAVAGNLAGELADASQVAVWATPTLETAVALVGALAAGVPAIPINPKSGERELTHILTDSAPDLVLAAPEAELPPAFDRLHRHDVIAGAGRVAGAERAARAGGVAGAERAARTGGVAGAERAARTGGVAGAGRQTPAAAFQDVEDPERPALIIYTSGTTGPPKGVVLPRRAIAASLDDLAEAWQWTERDVLAHALPLFHVHGLVLGTLGPLRFGGTLHHLGTFSPEAVAAALGDSATMLFGVPTMYHRLAAAAESDDTIASALGRSRLLVSGSAPLSVADHGRIERMSGQRVVERYGMTESLMICAIRADGERRAGCVGPPLGHVELRLVDDDGSTIEASDGTTVGEVHVRGSTLFLEYLGRPDATAEAFAGDWFRTGDVAVREADGYIRLIGRKSTDLIKSGGFKIGAGEIEAALLEHPGVREVAVTGEPDPDLGERIVAWVVPEAADAPPPADGLTDHVARLLTPHKRPRAIHYVEALPRNELGKIMKTRLKPSSDSAPPPSSNRSSPPSSDQPSPPSSDQPSPPSSIRSSPTREQEP